MTEYTLIDTPRTLVLNKSQGQWSAGTVVQVRFDSPGSRIVFHPTQTLTVVPLVKGKPHSFEVPIQYLTELRPRTRVYQ